jgi:hypothetical protein
MQRINLLCLLLLLLTAAGNAQPFSNRSRFNGPGFNPRMDIGKVYVRGGPLGLLDVYDGNFSLGGEYRLNRNWSVTMDAGYIFYSAYLLKAKNAMGIVLRPGIRWYTGIDRNVFIECQFHYKGVRYHVNDWLGKDAVNNVAAYEELKEFQYSKRVMGAQIMIGFRKFLWQSQRLFVETYLGWGFIIKKKACIMNPIASMNVI